MARDVQDTLRDVLHALDGAGGSSRGKSNNGLSGAKGVAAGAGAAALVPLAVKGAGRLVKGVGVNGLGDVVQAPQQALHGATSKLGDSVGSKLGDKVSQKVDEAGGPKGIAKDTLKDALPFGGGGDSKSGSQGNAPGVGKGRRMPVQQSVDIGVDIETVYNQFTQFEEWPNCMHRVTRVTQDDEETTVQFATKIWAKTKEFTAEIETQRPNERIKWSVSQGLTHTGVVTFHELGPHLTRILLTMDVEPGGLLEKAARGMRHIKRAARADLHRFKAFIEMTEQETGAWRGVIEDGEVVEEHDPKYDRNRDYADLDELLGDQDDQEKDDDSEKDDEKPAQRGRSRSRSSGSGGGSRSTSSRSTSSRSTGSRSSGSRSSGSRARNHSGSSSRSQATASGSQSRRRQSRSRNGHSE